MVYGHAEVWRIELFAEEVTINPFIHFQCNIAPGTHCRRIFLASRALHVLLDVKRIHNLPTEKTLV